MTNVALVIATVASLLGAALSVLSAYTYLIDVRRGKINRH
jgi:hypothetical protein